MLPLRANDARMYELFHDLEMRLPYPKRQVRRVEFIDRTSSYSEKSFKVTGLSVKEAIQLAKAWGQKSIIIEGLGLLDIKTLTYHPILKKYEGEAAYHRPMFSIVEGEPMVAFDFDFKRKLRYAS